MSMFDFFEQLPRQRMRDPLAEFLGVSELGWLDYGFFDVVKLTGHACPTVAAAWGLCQVALRKLYGDEVPVRGNLRVDCAANAADGVAGVVTSVFGFVTGAATVGGFKGLAGRYSRQNLLRFGVSLPSDYRFTRLDSGAAVDAAFDLRSVPFEAATGVLMSRCLAGSHTSDELAQFQSLWLDRVRRILTEHADDPNVFIVRPVMSSTLEQGQ